MPSVRSPRSVNPAPAEDLSVLSSWLMYSGQASPLYRHLAGQAFDFLRRRKETVACLDTAEKWAKYRQSVRDRLQEVVGPFPERTPLNARTVGTLVKLGYRMEKVVLEVRPEFYLTGCLFVPESLKGRAPAILNPIGHTDIAFRAWYYQQLILNLVQKGFVVFTFDPPGQGERLQYYDPAIGRSRIGGSTTEHSYVGHQCFLAGSCLARYWIWDGMRALDYLASRDEVDPQRLGVTGLSGGGTATAYLSAFDDRVAASSPACYITGFRRLLESIGPQDAEQNFPRGIAQGLDHADLLIARAPKPTLVVATTRDFFSIQGVRETVAEVRRAFAALGREDDLLLAEDDDIHGYTPTIREATYDFFQRYLDLPGDPAEEEVEYLTAEELQITATGQALTSLGGETVCSLNAKEAETAAAVRTGDAVTAARRLSGYVEPEPQPDAVFTGRYRRQGYSIERYLIRGEGDYRLPVLLLVPDGDGPFPGLLYLNPAGKEADAAPGEEMERLVAEGYAVLAPDLLGYGELAGPEGRLTYQEAFAAALIGRSVVGIQAGDLVRCCRFLSAKPQVSGPGVSGLARGTLCPALLHAAAFDDGIAAVTLVEPLASYCSVVASRFYAADPSTFVPGALTAYDLPDLMASLAPRPLTLVNAMDQNGVRLSREALAEELQAARRAYAEARAADALKTVSHELWQKSPALAGQPVLPS
ncbi:MAG: xylan esterase [Anaerolineae bacterium]|nr:xylan esterase [Anaerolineae bacterium]